MATSIEDRYDPDVAAALLAVGREGGGGLPDYLGIELVRFAPGMLWLRATLGEELLTPFGNVHGGALAALMDHCTGVVVYPLMRRGQWAATTSVTINYVAPVQAGVVEAEATVMAMTNRSAVVRGEAYYEGRLVCAAQGTLTVVDPRR